MANNQPSARSGAGTDRAPSGQAPERTDQVSSAAIAAALIAFFAGLYVALVALYLLGSLGIRAVMRIVAIDLDHETWGHLVIHACTVAADVLVVVLVLGAVALLYSSSDGAPPAA